MAVTRSSTQADMDAAQERQPQVLPLAGVRVLEFVHMVMGPSCGLVLADLGAEVIKTGSARPWAG